MTFQDLNLNKPLINALGDLDLTTPTAIQEKVFSPIMAGENVVGIAQTGTGKTYAYLLPVLRLWKFTKSPLPQILIIVPTRELVAQVLEEIKKLSIYINLVPVGVYGGTNMRKQKEAIFLGVDVIVGTPGRLVDLMMDGVLKPKKINKLIIDEVDEMLHLGFRTQLKNILDFLSEKRQNLMFSATMTPEVEEVIDLFTPYYKKIEAAPSGAPLENINQHYYAIENFNSKANLLELIMKEDPAMAKVLVFVDTKKLANALYERLHTSFEEKVGIIHSSKSQNFRFNAVESFQNGTFQCLIATDIIARGLDVSSVTHVVNFDLPEHPEKYIHRIGRTGRATQKGVAISFVTEVEEAYKQKIEKLMDLTIPQLELPKHLTLSEELIDLEKFDGELLTNKFLTKEHVPSGPAFHEKKEKNKKVNRKVRHEDLMKLKYKKPIKKTKKR